MNQVRTFQSNDQGEESLRSITDKELKNRRAGREQIRLLEKKHRVVTVLYAAKDREHNNAVALMNILKRKRG